MDRNRCRVRRVGDRPGEGLPFPEVRDGGVILREMSAIPLEGIAAVRKRGVVPGEGRLVLQRHRSGAETGDRPRGRVVSPPRASLRCVITPGGFLKGIETLQDTLGGGPKTRVCLQTV